MLKRRIIPCLDIKNGRVVKGVHFAGLRDTGDPVEAARAYDVQGADEICLLDITATVEGRETFIDVVHRVADQIFTPLTVGGGVRREPDVRRLLHAGADKVSINSAAVANPLMIRQLADRYGSQCIVVAVDVRKMPAREGDAEPLYEVVIHGGTRSTGLDALSWCEQVAALG
ncbi:MAG: imidazole glycerol phosphate synthase subunit HisF, partial [Myxococcales bacterium]|nr:imidazole glycerol phosphate synthase subunit HisF [Myxococcales bacterium]